MHQIDRALNKILGHSSSAKKTPPTLPVRKASLSAFSFSMPINNILGNKQFRGGGKIFKDPVKQRYPGREGFNVVWKRTSNILRKHREVEPWNDITNPRNEIDNRLENAREFIREKKYIHEPEYEGQRIGFEPTLVNQRGSISDGRHRLLALKQLGYTWIPVEEFKDTRSGGKTKITPTYEDLQRLDELRTKDLTPREKHYYKIYRQNNIAHERALEMIKLLKFHKEQPKTGGKITEQYLEKRGIDMGGYWVDEDKRPISEKYFKKTVRIFQRRPELIQRTVGTKILIRHPTEAYRAQFRPAESNTPEAIILTTDVLRGRMFKPEVRKRFEEIKRERELRGWANPIFVDAGEGAMEHELEHKRQYKAFPQEKLREQENQRIELEKKERERLGFPEWAKTEKEHNEQVKQYSPEYFKAIENLPIERLAHQTFYRTPEREKAQLVPEEQRMEAYRATMENPRSGGKFGHQYSFDNVGRKDIKTVWMQPSRFLAETKREFDERQKRNKDYPKTRLQTQEEYEREVLMPSHIAYLKKRIPSKTKEVAIPFLTYDRWGRPIEHEGRHTSAAARQLGLEKIPVTIEQRRYSREWEKPPSEGEVVNWQPIENFEGYSEQPIPPEYVYPSEIDYDHLGRKRSELKEEE